MRHVSPAVDGFEVDLAEVRRAADHTAGAARAVLDAADALEQLTLSVVDVGPEGLELVAAVARFRGRAAARLAGTSRALHTDAATLLDTAEAYARIDRQLAGQLERLA